MAEVTIRFKQGRTGQRAMKYLLWNLRGRATVASRITIEIDGVRQQWWDQEEDRMDQAHQAALTAQKEWERRNQAIRRAVRAEVTSNPDRTDEEIAAVIRMTVPGLERLDPMGVRLHRNPVPLT